MALDTGSSLFWSTGINNAGLMTGSAQAKGILAGLSKSITRLDVFAGLAIGSALIFAKISKQAYNFSKDFETAMKEVQTISKAVQNDFKGISKEIIAMSKTVPDNAQKLTKALYQIVSAGYDGAKAMEILRTSAELAVAGVTDTFTAADALTYVMNAYGEAAGTAAEISDKLFTIVKLGKVKMEELGPTLSMVTGLAAEAGMSFNDLAAFYAEAVKKIQPRIVSTGIRGFVTALLRASKEGAEAAKAAKEMGIEFNIATLESKGLGYMLKQMSDATEGQKQKLMELFPNVRGLIGLLAIMTNEGMNFNESLNTIETSLGNNTKAFKIMMDTTENQLAILRNNITAKLKPLGDELLASMNDIAKGINIAMSGANDEISKLARSYSELIDTLQRKQGRIDDLITTIEDLRIETRKGKDVTIELEAAERALMILLPNLGKAFEDAAGKVDILYLAKKGVLEVSREIMELELALAEIDKELADVALASFELKEDEVNKRVKRLREEVGTWYEEVSKKQTSYIAELFRTMEMYPLDPYGKQIDALARIYKDAGMAGKYFSERVHDIRKDMKAGEPTAERQEKLIKEITDALFARDKSFEETRLNLTVAELELGKAENQLRLNVKLTTEEYNIRTEAYEKFKEAISKPPVKVYPESKYGLPPETKEPTIIPVLTDEQIKAAEDKLKYMANQYKAYWKIINDQFEGNIEEGKEYIEEHNAQLAEDAENYGNYLDEMLEQYAGYADLTKEIMLDIAEYNKEITAKKKEAEEELFNYIAKAREKDLQAEKEKYDALIIAAEGNATKLEEIEKQYNINIEAINLEYDKKITEAKFVIFKAGLEQQIGEIDEVYKKRYEKQLIAAKAEIGKETEINKIFFKFIHNELNKIAKAKEEQAKIDEATLASYLDNYRTTEEKIAAIHTETNKLIELTDDKTTKNRLENIGKQKIAELEFADAMEKLNGELAGYKKDLDNKGLENYIEFLEEMKVKYKDFADIVILLNEKITESQKQIWEDLRSEIDQTADLLRNLADVVGNFDTELSQMINSMADLVSSIGTIVSGFATGNIFGIIGGIISGIGAIFNLFTVHHSDVPELEEQLHEITLELQEQQNILNQAVGTAKPEAIQNIIDLLNEQIDTYNEMIEAEEEAYAQFLWFTWSETDQQKIDQWLSSIQDINAEIANLNDQYNQILTGTTASAIADAIAEGFSQGLDSAQIFADTFNEMMKKSIMDAFKRTIITENLRHFYEAFAAYSEGGLTTEELDRLAYIFQLTLDRADATWQQIVEIAEAAGIDLFEETTIEEIIEQAEEAMEAIAGITEETIADSIAAGFGEGLDSAEVFANTFQDMMQRAIIDAFKKTIISRYLQSWYEQFNLLSGGGFTVAEINALAATYQNAVNIASAQWEAMEAILETAGIGLEIEAAKKTGLTGAIAGITEETAGLLAGQFQAIRINTVDILSNMESIIIINSQIAEHTSYNKYLENIWNKMNAGGSLENESLRAVGGV